MTDEEMMELYPPWLFPELYPEMFPDYVPLSTPVLDVVGTVDEQPSFAPESDPAVSVPVQDTSPVISLDQLGQLLNGLQAADDGSNPFEELPADEVPADPGDTLAVELDPGTLAVIKAVKDVKTELIQISDQLADMQLSEDRPLLTTSFSDYTVMEGLLLLLLLSVFLSACYKLLRGGFQWLRS